MLILFCQWLYVSIGNGCKCQWNCMNNSIKYFANNAESYFCEFCIWHNSPRDIPRVKNSTSLKIKVIYKSILFLF